MDAVDPPRPQGRVAERQAGPCHAPGGHRGRPAPGADRLRAGSHHRALRGGLRGLRSHPRRGPCGQRRDRPLRDLPRQLAHQHGRQPRLRLPAHRGHAGPPAGGAPPPGRPDALALVDPGLHGRRLGPHRAIGAAGLLAAHRNRGRGGRALRTRPLQPLARSDERRGPAQPGGRAARLDPRRRGHLWSGPRAGRRGQACPAGSALAPAGPPLVARSGRRGRGGGARRGGRHPQPRHAAHRRVGHPGAAGPRACRRLVLQPEPGRGDQPARGSQRVACGAHPAPGSRWWSRRPRRRACWPPREWCWFATPIRIGARSSSRRRWSPWCWRGRSPGGTTIRAC